MLLYCSYVGKLPAGSMFDIVDSSDDDPCGERAGLAVPPPLAGISAWHGVDRSFCVDTLSSGRRHRAGADERFPLDMGFIRDFWGST